MAEAGTGRAAAQQAVARHAAGLDAAEARAAAAQALAATEAETAARQHASTPSSVPATLIVPCTTNARQPQHGSPKPRRPSLPPAPSATRRWPPPGQPALTPAAPASRTSSGTPPSSPPPPDPANARQALPGRLRLFPRRCRPFRGAGRCDCLRGLELATAARPTTTDALGRATRPPRSTTAIWDLCQRCQGSVSVGRDLCRSRPVISTCSIHHAYRRERSELD